jgi:hypothetical protein
MDSLLAPVYGRVSFDLPCARALGQVNIVKVLLGRSFQEWVIVSSSLSSKVRSKRWSTYMYEYLDDTRSLLCTSAPGPPRLTSGGESASKPSAVTSGSRELTALRICQVVLEKRRSRCAGLQKEENLIHRC